MTADVDAVFQHVGGEGMLDGSAVLAALGGPHVDVAAFDVTRGNGVGPR